MNKLLYKYDEQKYVRLITEYIQHHPRVRLMV